ncbi:unnamed protein product [Heterotrigona itama]|uniref:BESS domain-containing protein n=1 Tax=Heterotrigona itama TaxID=395501 RepID=A0A6V7HJX0_9HYME|nr:unnamed protein product [Heterotrigona itama]
MICIPTLWYYNSLKFITKCEISSQGMSFLDDEIKNEPVENNIEDEKIQDITQNTEIQENRKITQLETTDNNSQKRKIKNTDILNLAIQSLQNYNATERKPDDDIIGKKIAFDLRGLDKQQLIIAEKIIAETIYYRELKKLNENSTIALNNHQSIPAHYISYNALPQYPFNSAQYSSNTDI